MDGRRRGHWTSSYLKRINSTEVTVKRRKIPRRKTLPEPGAEILVEFGLSQEPEKKPERTPDRVIYTPKREIVYISESGNIVIPETPCKTQDECVLSSRCKKRLFT
ncbi:uncharacterized protein NEMAJ01_2315 [Nematocida major]|uniref:uncharacterized protein n=1 Tax=Nematocida major TaxID=1912982 RepID=UPI002007A762|nr:uncharacterized protein NEMAJ01_2315 [Nematocida major]KAH9387419.1 hypothetical protein NEMAJ01_2315 [Nematocida major]